MSEADARAVRRQIEGWIAVAEVDRRAAHACLACRAAVSPSVAAFHCQQAAEKLLKGFLVHARVVFRKTHRSS